MDFLLWSVRSMHIFSVAVWLGGLSYQAVVTFPVWKSKGLEVSDPVLQVLRRFIPFVWFNIWTVLITGVALMLFDPRYMFFQFANNWSILLGMKQLTFLLMVFFSFGYARMLSRVQEGVASGDQQVEISRFYESMLQFGRITVALGIVAILLASGMN